MTSRVVPNAQGVFPGAVGWLERPRPHMPYIHAAQVGPGWQLQVARG